MRSWKFEENILKLCCILLKFEVNENKLKSNTKIKIIALKKGCLLFNILKAMTLICHLH